MGWLRSELVARFEPAQSARGFAVLDVNYGGSTGYGRPYRDLLAGTWGDIDVEDCVNGARHVAERGLADPERLTISGGSVTFSGSNLVNRRSIWSRRLVIAASRRSSASGDKKDAMAASTTNDCERSRRAA